jgi:hypothetical protein
MPVSTHIDTDRGVITYKATDEITVADMIAAFERVVDHPDFKPGMNAFCDAKYATFKRMAFSEVQALADLIAKRSSERGRGHRVAILVRGNEEFGLSSLFEMQTYSLPFEVQVFRNTREAKEWLGLEEHTAD